MTDTTAPAQTDDAKTSTPPWGDDFDAERAWSLIQNLRQEVKDVKAERDTLKSAAQEAEDEKKSESQRLADRLAAAEASAKESARTLLVERAIRQHNVPEDLVEFLTGETEDEINKKAERLGGLAKTPEPEKTEEPAPGLPGAPKPELTPGHGAESTPAFDPAAIAKASR